MKVEMCSPGLGVRYVVSLSKLAYDLFLLMSQPNVVLSRYLLVLIHQASASLFGTSL